jgi:error-prone DNA polymerase
VRDAREHGVEVRPVDVSYSAWDSTLEPPSAEGRCAMRLGLREVDGLKAEDVALFSQFLTLRRNAKGVASKGGLLVSPTDASRPASRAPQHEGFSIGDLHAFGIPVPALEKLAAADAFRSLGLDRRQALWEVKALSKSKALPLFAFADTREQGVEAFVPLPEMPLSEHMVNDYQTLKLSLKAHPMQFLRNLCNERKVTDNARLKTVRNGAAITVAGVVLVRQRPGSAKGVVFLTLEDEFSVCNAVIWPQVLETHRAVVMGSRLMLIKGRVQRTGDIIHVVAASIEDRTPWLSLLTEDGTTMKNSLARADEVAKPGPEPYAQPAARHPRNVRVIPKSRDFH